MLSLRPALQRRSIKSGQFDDSGFSLRMLLDDKSNKKEGSGKTAET